MDDRLITILNDLRVYCPRVKKINIDGLVFILQDIYYLDVNDWEAWRKEDGYRDWLVNNLTK